MANAKCDKINYLAIEFRLQPQVIRQTLRATFFEANEPNFGINELEQCTTHATLAT